MTMNRNVHALDRDEPASKRFKHDIGDFQDEGNTSFSTPTEAINNTNEKKGKTPINASYHRIMEKRRRDHMNSCLSDLSNLIPKSYSKQGQGRTEKTEVIKMAIQMITDLQTSVKTNESKKGHDPLCLTLLDEHANPCCTSKFYMGFKECQDEVMRFLVETEDNNASDQVCVSMMKHLGKAAKKFLPTVAMDKVENMYSCSSAFENRSRGSKSLSPIPSAENMPEHMLIDRYLDMSSDSGFANVRSAFASLLIPQGRNHSESSCSRAHDFSSNYEKSSMSSDSGHNVYKFKRNISQRFSQELKIQPSDTSSSSSNEEQNVRRNTLNVLNCNYNKEHSQYPNANDGIYNQSLQHNKREESSTSGCSSSGPTQIPGFILHPSGTHYFPTTINSADISDLLLSKNNCPSSICHPISIPVRFDCPSIQ